jgi:O-antigen/teichoic acid export membrane protein
MEEQTFLGSEKVRTVRITGADGFVFQVLSYWVASAVPMATSIVSVVVFTRLVSVEDYGRFVFVTSVVALLITGLSGWAEYAVLRVVPEQSDDRGTTAVMAVMRQLVARLAGFTAGLGLVGGLAAAHWSWLPSTLVPYVVPAAGVVLVRPVYQVLRIAYQARGQATTYAGYETVQAVLTFLVGVVMVGILPWGMAGRLWAETLVVGALAVAAGYALRGHDGNTSGWNPAARRQLARRVFRLGLPIVGWFSGLSLMAVLERGILRSLAGDAVVGSYGAVFALIERTSTLTFAPLLMAVFPRLVKIFADRGNVAAGAALGRAVLVFSGVAVVYLGAGFALAKPLLGIVVPRSYTVGADVVPWLLLAFVVWHLAMYAHKGAELYERTWTMLAAMGVAVTICAVANLLLIPRLGVSGVGAARLLASLAYLATVWWPSQRMVPWVFWGTTRAGHVTQ